MIVVFVVIIVYDYSDYCASSDIAIGITKWESGSVIYDILDNMDILVMVVSGITLYI